MQSGDVLQLFQWAGDIKVESLMWTKEVVVCGKEGRDRDKPVGFLEAGCRFCVKAKSTVEPFYHLLERAVFFGLGIKVLQSEDLLMRKRCILFAIEILHRRDI